jgi:hypothetical protein
MYAKDAEMNQEDFVRHLEELDLLGRQISTIFYIRMWDGSYKTLPERVRLAGLVRDEVEGRPMPCNECIWMPAPERWM